MFDCARLSASLLCESCNDESSNDKLLTARKASWCNDLQWHFSAKAIKIVNLHLSIKGFYWRVRERFTPADDCQSCYIDRQRSATLVNIERAQHTNGRQSPASVGGFPNVSHSGFSCQVSMCAVVLLRFNFQINIQSYRAIQYCHNCAQIKAFQLGSLRLIWVRVHLMPRWYLIIGSASNCSSTRKLVSVERQLIIAISPIRWRPDNVQIVFMSSLFENEKGPPVLPLLNKLEKAIFSGLSEKQVFIYCS